MSYPTQFYHPVSPSHYINFASPTPSPAPRHLTRWQQPRRQTPQFADDDDLDAQEAALQSQLARIQAAKEARAREQEAEKARIRAEVEAEVRRQQEIERARLEAEIRERIRQEEVQRAKLAAAAAVAKAKAEAESKRRAAEARRAEEIRRAEEARQSAILNAIALAKQAYLDDQRKAYRAQQERERQKAIAIAIARAREEEALQRHREAVRREEERQRAVKEREAAEAKRRLARERQAQTQEKGLNEFLEFLNGYVPLLLLPASSSSEGAGDEADGADVKCGCFGTCDCHRNSVNHSHRSRPHCRPQQQRQPAKEERQDVTEEENTEVAIPLEEFLTQLFGVQPPQQRSQAQSSAPEQPKEAKLPEPVKPEPTEPQSETKADSPAEFNKTLEDFLTGVFEQALNPEKNADTSEREEQKKAEEKHVKFSEEKRQEPSSTPTSATPSSEQTRPEARSFRPSQHFPFSRIPFNHPAVSAFTGLSEENAQVAFDGLMDDLLNIWGLKSDGQKGETRAEGSGSPKHEEGKEARQEKKEEVFEGKGKAKEVVEPEIERPTEPIYPRQSEKQEEVKPFEVETQAEQPSVADINNQETLEDVPESAADLASQKAQSTVEQIQAKYRENLLRVHRLEKLEALHSKLDKIESGWTFPDSLDFTPATSSPPTPSLDPVDGSSADGDLPPVPALAFTPKNADYHAHAQALLGLLVAADAISSDGDEEVRRVRKDFVKDVEAKLAEMERQRADVWKKQHEEQEKEEHKDDVVLEAVEESVEEPEEDNKVASEETKVEPAATESEPDVISNEEEKPEETTTTEDTIVQPSAETPAATEPENQSTEPVKNTKASVEDETEVAEETPYSAVEPNGQESESKPREEVPVNDKEDNSGDPKDPFEESDTEETRKSEGDKAKHEEKHDDFVLV